MAIRGPQRPDQQLQVKPERAQPQSPLQRLQDFGAARTPTEARQLLTQVLASLRAAGFPVPRTGSAEGQLGQGLKLFQQARGLPADGKLDKATLDALVDAGHLPRADGADAADAAGGRKSARTDTEPGVGRAHNDAPARFVVDVPRGQPRGAELGLPTGGPVPEGAKSSQTVELQQLADKAAQFKPPEIDLKSFLSSLRQAGFAAGGKGAEQLKDSLKKLQRAEGLPQTGKLDARTAEALVRRGIVDERALPLALAAAQPDAPPATQQSAKDAAANAPNAQRDADTRGAQASADSDAVKGRGERDGSGAGVDGKGGEGQSSTSGTHASSGGDGAGGAGDVDDPWREGADGNAPAGDDDVDDARRGHANVDDRDALDDAGHWEVASLSEQISEGLAAIERDDDGAGAATYAWDFTLYRPGVYGAKQPAERLFHLVVAQASAFDPLWEKARQALNAKLEQLEPEAPLVESEDFARALRIARVRE